MLGAEPGTSPHFIPAVTVILTGHPSQVTWLRPRDPLQSPDLSKAILEKS